MQYWADPVSKNPRPVSDLCGCARIPPKSRGSPLNGVEPAGTMLEYNSFNSLRNEPSAGNRTIRLQTNLTQPSPDLRSAHLLDWSACIGLELLTLDNVIRAQLDSARHPDLLAQSIMSEATAQESVNDGACKWFQGCSLYLIASLVSTRAVFVWSWSKGEEPDVLASVIAFRFRPGVFVESPIERWFVETPQSRWQRSDTSGRRLPSGYGTAFHPLWSSTDRALISSPAPTRPPAEAVENWDKSKAREDNFIAGRQHTRITVRFASEVGPFGVWWNQDPAYVAWKAAPDSLVMGLGQSLSRPLSHRQGLL
jgi:hypothetical protein